MRKAECFHKFLLEFRSSCFLLILTEFCFMLSDFADTAMDRAIVPKVCHYRSVHIYIVALGIDKFGQHLLLQQRSSKPLGHSPLEVLFGRGRPAVQHLRAKVQSDRLRQEARVGRSRNRSQVWKVDYFHQDVSWIPQRVLLRALAEPSPRVWSGHSTVIFNSYCSHLPHFSAPRFRGWQQQDSQELLRYLIDGLRQEEVDAIGHSIKNYLTEKGVTEDAVELKRAHLNFVKPALDCVFGGTLLQIICCLECGHNSTSFEPFLGKWFSMRTSLIHV